MRWSTGKIALAVIALTASGLSFELSGNQLSSSSATPNEHPSSGSPLTPERLFELDRASRSQDSGLEPTTTTSSTSTTSTSTTSTVLSPTTTTLATTTTVRAKTPTTPPPAPSQTTPKPAAPDASASTPMERSLLELVNNERSARGLAPLVLDSGLSSRAVSWSQHMAQIKRLEHSSLKLTNAIDAVAENVLTASTSTTAAQLQAMWQQSSFHRLNMLQPGFDHVGIGVVCAADGVYATEVFAHFANGGLPSISNVTPSAAPQAPIPGNTPNCLK